MSFDFLTADDFRGFIWGSFPRPLIAIYSLHLLPRQMSATSGAKRLWVVSCLLPLHLL